MTDRELDARALEIEADIFDLDDEDDDECDEFISIGNDVNMVKEETEEEIKARENKIAEEKALLSQKIPVNARHFTYKSDYNDIVECILTDAPRSVTLTVPLTGREEVIENIQFLSMNHWDYVFVSSDAKMIGHYNIDTTVRTFKIKDKDGNMLEFKGQAFCNDIHPCDVFENPEVATQCLALNMTHSNASDAFPNSRYFLEENLSATEPDSIIKCNHCGDFIKKTASPFSLIFNICKDCLTNVDSALENLDLNTIEKDGYYIKTKTNSRYKHYKTAGVRNKSSYYSTIKASDVLKDVENVEKIEKDIICLGLGSAGTSIIEQLGRTALIKNYTLVDFDKVERKNLRNQFYVAPQIGRTKSDSARAILATFNKHNVKSYDKKFQDINFTFVKSKYIVLGFDTIKTRLEAFEKIADKSMESRYIIDIRYNNLDSSIYFIDTSNEPEMKYYYQTLLSDMANLAPTEPEAKIMTPEMIKEIMLKFNPNIFTSYCSDFNAEVFEFADEDGCVCDGRIGNCGGYECLKLCADKVNSSPKLCEKFGVDYVTTSNEARPNEFISNIIIDQMAELFDRYSVKHGSCGDFTHDIMKQRKQACRAMGGSSSILDGCGSDKCMQACCDIVNRDKIVIDNYTNVPQTETNSCLRQNIVHCYKFASSYITASITEIEGGKEKPFVHVETTVAKFPRAMKIK